MRRRRFLQIAAGGAMAASGAGAGEWRGQALGADVQILLRGSRAPDRVIARLSAELTRIEDTLSLYRESELTRLNRAGAGTPSPLMREAIALAHRVHEATDGVFDPSVQTIWTRLTAGQPAGVVAARFADLSRSGPITLHVGQTLTFNGLAQGLATDRIAALPELADLGEVLVDMGEQMALNGSFPLGLSDPAAGLLGQVTLRPGRAIATSSPGVLRFAGGQSHILGPQGQAPRWSTVSVEAESAALADAAATAFVLMTPPAIAAAAVRLGVGPLRLVDFDGNLQRWG